MNSLGNDIISTKQKRTSLTLARYVGRRNGVPLGTSGSLRNMVSRSLGAGSFSRFWQYWNPIWGYLLGRYIYSPLQRIFSVRVALVLTFLASGAIHDLATTLVRGTLAILFTPWFFFMSLVVLLGQAVNMNYANQPFLIRVMFNLAQIIGCLVLAIWLTRNMSIP